MKIQTQKTSFPNLFFFIFFSFSLLFYAPFLYSLEYGKVKASALDLRSGPTTKDKILITLKKGALLEIHERKNGWLKVRFGSITGWVNVQYVAIYHQGPVKGKVTAQSLNVHSGRGLEYKKIFRLYRGEKVNILEEQDGWYKIQFKLNSDSTNTGIGWVFKKYVETDTPFLPPRRSIDNRSLSNKVLLGNFKPTFYWIIYEGDYSNHAAKAPVYNEKGEILGYFPKKFVNRLWLEGSGKLKDGRVLNYLYFAHTLVTNTL